MASCRDCGFQLSAAGLLLDAVVVEAWAAGYTAEPGHNWRCWMAFFLNIATILFCLAFAGLLLPGFLAVLR